MLLGIVSSLDAQSVQWVTSRLVSGVMNRPYSMQLQATGPGAVSYSLAAGTLPAGLTLSSGGLISGTTAVNATVNLSIRATSGTASATRDFTLPILDRYVPLNWVVSTFPNGLLNQPYSNSLYVIGFPDYQAEFVSGTLPAGLQLDIATLRLSGVPTQVGFSNFVLRFTDAFGVVETRNFTVSIQAAGMRLQTTEFTGNVGQIFRTRLVATGGTAPYRYQAPANARYTVTLEGEATVMPERAGVNRYPVIVTDAINGRAELEFTVTAGNESLTWTNGPVTAPKFGVAYLYMFEFSGAVGIPRCTVASGAMPKGLYFEGCYLRGTAEEAGNFEFTVRAVSEGGATLQMRVQMTVGFADMELQSIQNLRVREVDSTEPYFSVTGGQPPYMMYMNELYPTKYLVITTGGVLLGDESRMGIVDVRIRDARANSIRQVVIRGPLRSDINTYRIFSEGTVGVPLERKFFPYTQMLCKPKQYTMLGAEIPPGMTWDAESMVLRGTPTTAGIYKIELREMACKADMKPADKQEIVVWIRQREAVFQMFGDTHAIVGQAYQARIEPIGMTGTFQYALANGSIPTGCQFTADGQVRGTPLYPGRYQYQARATSSTGQQYLVNLETIVAAGGVTIETPEVLPEGQVGVSYNYTLRGTAGTKAAVMGIEGTDRLQVRSNVLSTVPEEAGTYEFWVTATHPDVPTANARRLVRMTVRDRTVERVMPEDWVELPIGVTGQAYRAMLNVRGATRYRLHPTDPLPPGMSLSASGELTGTPPYGGMFAFRVEASPVVAGKPIWTVILFTAMRPGPRLATQRMLGPVVWNEKTTLKLPIEGGVPPYEVRTDPSPFPPYQMDARLNGKEWVVDFEPQEWSIYGVRVKVKDQTGVEEDLYWPAGEVLMTLDRPKLAVKQLPTAIVNEAYEAQIVATGGTGGPYRVTMQNVFTSLPGRGLTLTPEGKLIGKPRFAGQLPLDLRIVDADGNWATERVLLNVEAARRQLSAPGVRLNPTMVLGSSVGMSVGIEGGQAPVRYRVRSGSLPAGVKLVAEGVLVGKLVAPGTTSAVIEATDAAGMVVSREVIFEVPMPVALPAGRVGVNYATTFGMTLTAAEARSLVTPRGLAVNETGALSGTPTVAGEYVMVVGQRAFVMSVAPSAELDIETRMLRSGIVGVETAQTLRLSENFPGVYEWIEGALPPGLKLGQDGVLRGVPLRAGRYEFGVKATLVSRTASRHYEMTVVEADEAALLTLVNSASYAENGVAPGELLTGFGKGLGPQSLATLQLDAGGRVGTELGGTRVLANGRPLALIYAAAGQVSAIAPWNAERQPLLWFTVEREGRQTAAFRAPYVATKPGLFTLDATGRGAAAVLNQNGSLNTPQNGAFQGEVVVAYLTGGGMMQVMGQTGAIADRATLTTAPAQVTVCGIVAETLYAGNAPGLVEGVVQVNFKVPVTAPRGACEVRVKFGEAVSPAGVTLSVM